MDRAVLLRVVLSDVDEEEVDQEEVPNVGNGLPEFKSAESSKCHFIVVLKDIREV